MFRSKELQSVFINESNHLFQSLFNLGRENNLTEARKLVDTHRTKYINLYNIKGGEPGAAAPALAGAAETNGTKTVKKRTHNPTASALLPGEKETNTCSVCSKQFSNVNALIEHKKNVHVAVKQHNCDQCEKLFSSKKYLKNHFERCHGEKKFQCEFCGFRTRRKDQLARHKECAHVKGQIMKCTKCMFTCFTKNDLQQHISAEHTIIYSCPACDKKFSKGDSRDTHYRLEHCTEKPHACELCGHKFSAQHSLMKHQRTVHYGVKAFSCEDCGQYFTKNEALKAHISAIHFGERPYQCYQCDKAFAQKGNLDRHVESVHEGFRPYACSECGRHFSQRSVLQRHVNAVHTKAQVYNCTQCEKKFYRRSHLYRHTKTKHKPPTADVVVL